MMFLPRRARQKISYIQQAVGFGFRAQQGFKISEAQTMSKSDLLRDRK